MANRAMSKATTKAAKVAMKLPKKADHIIYVDSYA